MMKKIRFRYDAYVDGELFAKKGEEKLIDDSKGSASRWIKRGHELIEGKIEGNEPKKKIVKKAAPKKVEKKEQKKVEEKKLDAKGEEKSEDFL